MTKTYLHATSGACNLVLTKSSGWNKIVEQQPLNEPAANAFHR